MTQLAPTNLVSPASDRTRAHRAVVCSRRRSTPQQDPFNEFPLSALRLLNPFRTRYRSPAKVSSSIVATSGYLRLETPSCSLASSANGYQCLCAAPCHDWGWFSATYKSLLMLRPTTGGLRLPFRNVRHARFAALSQCTTTLRLIRTNTRPITPNNHLLPHSQSCP